MYVEIITLVIVIDLVAGVAIVRSRESLKMKIAWLVAVLLLPIVGAVFFFVLTDRF